MTKYTDNASAAHDAAVLYVREAMGIAPDAPLPIANTPASVEFDDRYKAFGAGAAWALDELPNSSAS